MYLASEGVLKNSLQKKRPQLPTGKKMEPQFPMAKTQSHLLQIERQTVTVAIIGSLELMVVHRQMAVTLIVGFSALILSMGATSLYKLEIDRVAALSNSSHSHSLAKLSSDLDLD